MERAGGCIVEQIIRPTGLLDPVCEIRGAQTQVDDLLGELRARVEKNERVLVTTLTKRMAEDLTQYYSDIGLKVKYLHSDIGTIERVEILRELRMGSFDILIGINLLREGLDLPEVSLVAILDADKEGFLRSERSLIQTFGRAARNVNGRVLLYADKITRSMNAAMDETTRRRKIQRKYNKENNITPETIKSSIKDILSSIYEEDYYTVPIAAEDSAEYIPPSEIPKRIKKLKKEMLKASKALDFEKAADLRDEILELEDRELGIQEIKKT
jgi:excinuclease ABC subunit B